MPTQPVPARDRRRERRGSVSQLPSGAWSVRITENGRRSRLRGGPWDTETEARNALTRWLAQALDGDTARRTMGRTTLREVYAHCVRPLGGWETSHDRRVFYRSVISGEAFIWVGTLGVKTGPDERRKVSPIPGRIVLGDLAIADIGIETIEDWATSLRETGLGPNTIAKFGRHLSQALEWARVRGYIQTNPMHAAVLVARGAVSEARPPRYLFTLEELVRLAQATPDEWRGLVHMLSWSGLRQGEARALRPETLIYRPGSMVHVTNSVDTPKGKPTLGRTKTEASQRRVAIPRQVAHYVNQLVLGLEIPNGRPIWPGENETTWLRGETLNVWFRQWCDAAGLQGNAHDRVIGRRKAPVPHDLRATGASILFAAGAGVPEVQAWLGHQSPQLILKLYTEVASWGEEDPIPVGLRGRGLTVPEILSEAFEQAWERYGRPVDRAWWDITNRSENTAS